MATLVRLLLAVGALAAGGVAVVTAVAVLSRTPGPVAGPSSSRPAAPTSAAGAAQPTSSAGALAPPPSAVVFMREDRASVLALGVTPRRRALALQASVLSPQGTGTSGLAISFTVAGRTVRATVCGAGCYRSTVPAPARPRAVDVAVRGGPLATRWHVALPAVWPAPDATALIRRAERTWRSLLSLAYVERLASGPRHATTSHWRVAAPSSAAYRIPGGASGIVIGGKRWDRFTPNGRWTESAQTARITQPVPFWISATNAHVVGSGTVGGRPVWRVSFFDPSTPAWFVATLDKATTRTLELDMMATSHFMHDTYRAFNSAPAITPP